MSAESPHSLDGSPFAVSAEHIEQDVRAECLRLLWSHSPTIILGSLLTGSMAALGAALYFQQSSSLIWGGIFAGFCAVRWRSYRQFLLVQHQLDSAAKIEHWLVRGQLFSAFAGGFIGVFLALYCNVAVAAALYIVLLGSSSPTLGAIPRVYRAFAIPLTAGLMVRLIQAGGPLATSLAAMSPLWLLAFLFIAGGQTRVIEHNIRQKLQNVALVEYLAAKRARAVDSQNEAVRADLAKSRFLAAASHDLRQPLHAISLWLGLLKEQDLPEASQNIVNRLLDSHASLATLFDALLDVSRLDSGALVPVPALFPLRELADQLESELLPLAQRRGLALHVDVANCHWTETDALMLTRILRNLLINALRYTQSGEVSFRVLERDEQLVLQVADSGPGMATEQLARAFDEFVRFDEGPGFDLPQGLGLGLSIVQRLVRLLEIPMSVQSQPGIGTSFELLLPRRDALDVEVISEQRPSGTAIGGGRRVLLLDQDQHTRRGLSELLEIWGYQVLEAGSKAEAFEYVRKDQRLGMVLVDCSISGAGSGVAALEEICAGLEAHVPRIIISAETDVSRLAQAMQCGYQVLHKPVAAAELKEVLERSSLKFRELQHPGSTPAQADDSLENTG